MSHRRVSLLTTESKDILFNEGDFPSCSYRRNEHIWSYFAILFFDFSHWVFFPSPSPLLLFLSLSSLPSLSPYLFSLFLFTAFY